jgi:hypothetical protein
MFGSAISPLGRRLTTALSSVFDRMLCNGVSQRRPIDYERVAYLQAAQQSAAFFVSEMRLARNLVGKRELLEFALGEVRASGLWLEFGVARGKDIRVISARCPHVVHEFGSFMGLPEDWTHFQRAGRFSTGGAPPKDLPLNATIEPGLFADRLPAFIERHPEPSSSACARTQSVSTTSASPRAITRSRSV